MIEQSGWQFVRPGQRVRLSLSETPGRVLYGTVREIAKRNVEILPHEIAAGHSVATRRDPRGAPTPLETSYQARVELDPHDHELLVGAQGQAKILADPQPLFRRIWRYLRRTFSISL
jgi:hypothetical protein